MPGSSPTIQTGTLTPAESQSASRRASAPRPSTSTPSRPSSAPSPSLPSAIATRHGSVRRSARSQTLVQPSSALDELVAAQRGVEHDVGAGARELLGERGGRRLRDPRHGRAGRGGERAGAPHLGRASRWRRCERSPRAGRPRATPGRAAAPRSGCRARRGRATRDRRRVRTRASASGHSRERPSRIHRMSRSAPAHCFRPPPGPAGIRVAGAY